MYAIGDTQVGYLKCPYRCRKSSFKTDKQLGVHLLKFHQNNASFNVAKLHGFYYKFI